MNYTTNSFKIPPVHEHNKLTIRKVYKKLNQKKSRPAPGFEPGTSDLLLQITQPTWDFDWWEDDWQDDDIRDLD